MPSLREGPPLKLSTYRNTILRAKMHYIVTLLKWARAWLDEVQEMSVPAALDGLAHAKKVRRFASSVEAVFTEAAVAEMLDAGVESYEGEDYTAVLRPGSERRNWKSTEVIEELIETETRRQRSLHPDIEPSVLRRIVTESVWRLYKVARPEWRSTDLRKVGIYPDDFSESVPVPASIDLRGEGSYATGRKGGGSR